MLPVILGFGAALLALAATHKSAPEVKLGTDGKPAKVRTEQDIFADGEKAGRAAADSDMKVRMADEARIKKLARGEARYWASMQKTPAVEPGSDE